MLSLKSAVVFNFIYVRSWSNILLKYGFHRQKKELNGSKITYSYYFYGLWLASSYLERIQYLSINTFESYRICFDLYTTTRI